MITASEAREKIEALATERGRQEQQTAEKVITRAVENGDSSCWLGIYVSEATEKWLKSLGYQVEKMSSQKDGSNTKVKW